MSRRGQNRKQLTPLEDDHRTPVKRIWADRLGAGEEYMNEWLDAVIQTNRTVGVVAEVDSDVVAFGIGCIVDEEYLNGYVNHPDIEIDAWDHTGLIHVFAVDAAYESRGFGRSIIDGFVDFFTKVDCGGVVVVSWHRDDTRDSRCIFDSAAFTQVLSRPRFYAEVNDDPHCVDCDGDCSCGGSIYRLAF